MRPSLSLGVRRRYFFRGLAERVASIDSASRVSQHPRRPIVAGLSLPAQAARGGSEVSEQAPLALSTSWRCFSSGAAAASRYLLRFSPFLAEFEQGNEIERCSLPASVRASSGA